MAFRVISECVDARTGTRYAPPAFFPAEADNAEQVDRLVKAGCLREVSDKRLDADEKEELRATRDEAAAELAQIERALGDARTRRDAELAAIAKEIGDARAAGDVQLTELRAALAAETERLKAETMPVTTTRDPAEIAREQINEDGLFDKTIADLREIAETEGVDLAGATRKDEIVAAIRAKRAAQPGA